MRPKSFYDPPMKNAELKPFFLLILLFLCISNHVLALDRPKLQEQFTVDAVVASVNGDPITLHDVLSRLGENKRLGLKEASSDPNVRMMLDQIILEHVILDEAKSRKLDVSDDEVSRYIDEVAKRNNLSRDGFEKALTQEHKSLAEYKRQIKIEILKSKLSANLIQAGVSVSDAEVKDYLSAHPELSKAGEKVKLSQIFVGLDTKSEDQARQIADRAKAELEDGKSFSTVAAELSDGPEAKDGGSLGLLSMEDLSSQIFEAVFSLKPGETSAVVKSERGFHIFRMEERFQDKEKDKKIEEQVREALQREKLKDKAQNFFTSELFKNHSIDKKI